MNENVPCVVCGMCVASCSGQAIFLMNEDVGNGMATITMPYEFLLLPQTKEKDFALNRSGKRICGAEVISLRSAKAFY